jgi:hypothetical protein
VRNDNGFGIGCGTIIAFFIGYLLLLGAVLGGLVFVVVTVARAMGVHI